MAVGSGQARFPSGQARRRPRRSKSVAVRGGFRRDKPDGDHVGRNPSLESWVTYKGTPICSLTEPQTCPTARLIKAQNGISETGSQRTTDEDVRRTESCTHALRISK